MAFPSKIDLSSLNGTNGFRLDGERELDRSGTSVSSAGDVNGDGFDDLIVGIERSNEHDGVGYVIFGQASKHDSAIDLSSLNGINGFRFDAEGHYGYSRNFVSSAGDVNGDGFDDIIVGVATDDWNGEKSGSSYVVFGKPFGYTSVTDLSLLNGINGFRLDGEKENNLSGYSVSSAGDINGDGFDDLFVGAIHAGTDHKSSGSSYVIFGKNSEYSSVTDLSSLNGTNGFRLDGERSLDYSGTSISSAGDLNGDGFDDLIIGAYGADYNSLSSGSSYVVFGKISNYDPVIDLSSLNGANGFRLDGEGYQDFSGGSVSSAGDINGDGFDDIIVGANGTNEHSGSSYVIFGKISDYNSTINLSSLDGTDGFRLDGEGEHDASGLAVSSAGDVNGDGLDDLIIGAPYANVSGKHSGSSYVVFGKTSGYTAVTSLSSLDGFSGFRIDGVENGDRSGYSVSSAGDVNDDGFDDLIIGARDAASNDFSSGSSYVVFGGPSAGPSANGMPVAFLPDHLDAVVGTEISYDLADLFSDPDGDEVTLTVSNLPEGMEFDSVSGMLTGTVRSEPSTHEITIQASDGRNNTLVVDLKIEVRAAAVAWDFDSLDRPDVLTFSYLSADSYNGDVEGGGMTTTIRPPEGWTAILTSWDGSGAVPRDADGKIVETLTLDAAPGMQATAYREDATGRVVLAYRGTDGDGVNSVPELVNTSILLGLGQESEAVNLRAAVDFYQFLVRNAGVNADDISFTGHSLGGMYAGFLAGATASQGMIFASGPHTAMLDYLRDDVDLSPDPAFGFIPASEPFDFSRLANTRVTGEILMGGVDTAVQTVSTLDTGLAIVNVTRASWITKLLESNTSALLDAFGGADVEGTDLPELTAGFSSLWKSWGESLNPIELHSMNLHMLLTAVENDPDIADLDDPLYTIPGFLPSLFEDGLSSSARLGAGIYQGAPDNAGTMLRDIVLTTLDGRHDVLEPLLRDAMQIVGPLSEQVYGFHDKDILGRQSFKNYDVADMIGRVLIEYAYRSTILNLGAEDASAYDEDTFSAARVDGWQILNLDTLGGGGWFGTQSLLDDMSIRGLNVEFLYPGVAAAFDSVAIRSGILAPSRYDGTIVNDLIIGLQNADGSGNTLYGGGGNDLLIGTEGNDQLFAGDGSSLLIGGDGNDTYQVSSNNGAVQNEAWEPSSHVVIADTGGEDRLLLDVFGSYSERIDQYSTSLTLNIGANTVEIADFFLGYSPRYDGTRIQGEGYIEDIHSSGRRMSFIAETANGDGTSRHNLVSQSSTGEEEGFLVTASLESRDLIYGASNDLINRPTVVFGFDERDELHISNSNGGTLTSQNFSYREGSIIIDIDFDLDGEVDSFVRLAGDYEDFDVVVETNGDDAVLTLRNTAPNQFDQIGTDGADTLTASNDGDRIDGLGGDDVLLGRDGDDVLYGGAGDDNLQGVNGTNDFYGGVGNDTYHVWNGNSRVYEFFGEGNDDTVHAYANYTQPLGVENMFISSLAQRGTGNAESNIIDGNTELDSLLEGMGGNDYLRGANPNDTINGGTGNDTLDGGSGDDTAVFAGNSNEFSVMENADGSFTIVDNNTDDLDEGTDQLRSIEFLSFLGNDRVLRADSFRTPDPDPALDPGLVESQNPVARRDAFTGTLDAAISGNLLADNGFGADSDPQSDSLTVVALNGSTDAIGNTLILGSGASIVLQADGGFVYDAGDAFDDAEAGSALTESLTYRIGDRNGNMSAATVLIDLGNSPEATIQTLPGTDGDDDFVLENLNTLIIFDGMKGLDSLTIPDDVGNFSIVPIDGGFRLVPEDGEGIDALSVEQLVFDDATLALTLDTETFKLAFIYEAAFDRLGDIPGLTFWDGVRNDGLSLSEIADFFAASEEFAALNGEDLTNDKFVDVNYRNALNRDADAEGLAYWTGLLDDGSLDRGDVLEFFAYSNELANRIEPLIDDGLYLIA